MNQQIFYFLYNLAHKNSFMDLVFVFFAKYLLYVMVAVFIYLLVKEKNRLRRFHFAFLATLSIIISSGIIAPVVRFFYPNPRPFSSLPDVIALIAHPENSSFPSGHMMLTVPLALAAYYLNPRVGRWFLAGAFLMGVARVIVGVHWPADILAGMILAAAAFYLAQYILTARGTASVNHKKEESVL